MSVNKFFKSGTSNISPSLGTKGNMTYGSDGDTDFGPSSKTGFYRGLNTDDLTGYVIYRNDTVGSAITAHVAYDDNQLMFFLKSFGATGNTVSEMMAWANSSNIVFVEYGKLNLTPTPSITPTRTLTPTPTNTPTATRAGNKKILFLGDTGASSVASYVNSYITATGYSITYSAVTIGTAYTGNSGITTSNYDAVVYWTNASQTGAPALSTALQSYVNSGGSVITGVFSWNLYPSGFPHSGITAFNVTNSQSSNATGNFSIDVPSVITNNVGTSVGSSMFTNSNPTLVSGATLMASYSSDSTKFIAIKETGSSKLVSINAFLSNIASSGSTLTKIVGNSILYAAGALVNPTPTPTPTSVTPTPTATPTLTPSITPTNTLTPTITPSITPTKSITPSITPTISLTPSFTPTNTITPTPTVTSVTPTPTPSSPSIVMSGLAFNLYTAPSAGTTWTDASGNNLNATLNGSTTYLSNNGGGIRLNNTSYTGNAYISLPYNITGGTITVEVVASFNPTTTWATIWANENYNANSGFMAYMSSSTNIQFGRPNAISSQTITASDSIRHWVFVISGTTQSLYLNNSLVGNNTVQAQTSFATGNFYFGARHQNGGSNFTDVLNNSNVASQPVFYQMRLYNRALSTGEISTNFNSVKGLYGL